MVAVCPAIHKLKAILFAIHDWLIMSILISYILGSIPFGLLVGFMANKDVRKAGSGNIGFTNVLRVCGAKWGVPVLILDIFKGFAPAFWIAPALAGNRQDILLPVMCGVAAILGHNFPVWLRFKGGKGVATSAGVVLALMPRALGVALVVWLTVVAISRYISLGSMLASTALAGAYFCFTATPFSRERLPLTIMALLLPLLVILRHKGNIQRLLAGTENRLGSGKTKSGKQDQPAEETKIPNRDASSEPPPPSAEQDE